MIWARQHAVLGGANDAPGEPVIVWNAPHVLVDNSDHSPEPSPAPWVRSVVDTPPGLIVGFISDTASRLGDLGATFTKTTFNQQHGASPMETSRFVGHTGLDAALMLGGGRPIEWHHASCSGSMSLETFHVEATELGTPWVANARLHRRHARDLDVSVAVLSDGPHRCRIEVRPRFRRPWAVRRLRRCLQSTHAAADRLRELVLTADLAADLVADVQGPTSQWMAPTASEGRQ